MNVKQFRDRFSQHPSPTPETLARQLEQTFGGLRFEFESADIIGTAGTPLHGRKLLENLADEDGDFRIQLILRPVPEALATSLPVATRSSRAAREPEPRLITGSPEAASGAAIRQAIEKLRRLELEAKLPFVALRYFRDRHLNGDYQLLRALTDRGVLTVSKTENPNDPDHPVTTIRANRAHPLVKEVYEQAHHGQAPGRARRRIQVQGTPLSQMIVDDRR